MLELWQPEGALEALEEYLADGLHDGLVADVYLGYGLAETLRREPWPAPPEPCPLPVAAARIRPADERERPARSPFRVGEWEPTWAPDDYGGGGLRGARRDRARRRLPGQPRPAPVRELRGRPGGRSRPRLRRCVRSTRVRSSGDGWAIVSASPELFLARRGERLWTMPIKGTRPIGEDIDDAKDAAEHMMIVDLERNDLSRVCRVGSIRWPELMVQHELAGVTHLVSTVEGRLRPGTGLAEILRATFPGGSITGAPKIAAIDHIARLEPVGRGAAMGALGTIQANGDFELALTIRTFAVAAGRIHLWVGGGIVWDSEPEAEIEESWVKARPLLAAVSGKVAV